MTDRRSVGRPKGTKLSDETKRKIGKGVRERARAGEPIPPGDGIALDVRRAVFERDERRCVGCHESFVRPEKRLRAGFRRTELDMTIHRFAAAAENAGLEAYATLCGECRRGITRGTRGLSDYLDV